MTMESDKRCVKNLAVLW